MPRLTDLLGTDVLDPNGRRIGRLADLAASLDEEYPRVTSLRVRHRRSTTSVPWRLVQAADPTAIRLQATHDRVLEPGGELLLAGAVLDRQLFDAAGRHVTRVGDVVLERHDEALRVVGVETGAAPILRRLGLRRLADDFGPTLVAWPDLHLLSGPGHALQLASAAAGVHRLEPVRLADLVHRAHHRRGAEILEAVGPDKAASALRLLAGRRARRRSSDPLSVRRRAPS